MVAAATAGLLVSPAFALRDGFGHAPEGVLRLQGPDGREESHHLTSRSALLTAVGYLSDRVEALPDAALQMASRRHGWTSTELLVAAELDLQRLLRNLLRASSTPAAPPGQRAPYGPSEAAHRTLETPEDYDRFVRTVASAYTAPAVLRVEFASTIDAVCLAALSLAEGSVLVEDSLPAEVTRVRTGDFLLAWSQLLAGYLGDLPSPER